ncbi:MAG TPA: hypothetical protein VHY35_05205 [Stellaceae bacterium]|jgi:hypothetical protein|nr:hypothetical protein [Stellaceae bacterium]
MAAGKRQLTQTDAAEILYSPRVFNARSRQRFKADRTAQLVRHLGRDPSYPEQIIIARITAIEWDLRRMDHRIDCGEELSGHALRARLAAETRLRLDLRDLGMKPAAARQPTLANAMQQAAEVRLRGAAA